MVDLIFNGPEILRFHRQALEASMNELGDRVVIEIHDSINDPYPPSSEEDTPPHRRTGLLAAGVRQDTELTANGAKTDIQSARAGRDALIPAYLEFGTEIMAPRPYMGPAMIEWAGKILTLMPELYGEHFGG